MYENELVGGPQDGATVVSVTGFTLRIWTGKTWQGDGHAAWSQNASARFPCQYDIAPGGTFDYE